jgi:hypothetical protein
LLAELIYIHPRDLLDDLRQNNEVHIGILKLLANRRDEFEIADLLPSDFGAFGVVGNGIVGDQTALVDQQIADRDGVFAMRRELGEDVDDRLA